MHDVLSLIFSCTAAVFSDPCYLPIGEARPNEPVDPYDCRKIMVEQMWADYDQVYSLKSGCLRYFNVAGPPDGKLGERHDPETRLIPLVLQATPCRRTYASVFGCDYDAPDGTCMRDYVHIADLCEAHALALQDVLGGMVDKPTTSAMTAAFLCRK